MIAAEKLRFCKGDWLAVAAVVTLAVAVLLLFVPGGDPSGSQAQIYQDGQLVKTVALQEDQTFRIEGRYSNQITVADGSIAFTSSDCPGQDCVHSGSVDRMGRSLVCLPNGVEIRVISGSSDVDFVVG